jgi:hypothetical protein
MNSRWKPLPGQHKAMMAEIRRQKKQWTEDMEKNVDVAVLWALHDLCGFGEKRLKDFFDGFNRIYKELVAHYDMESDMPWVYEQKLKEIGVNVAEWRKEESHE